MGGAEQVSAHEMEEKEQWWTQVLAISRDVRANPDKDDQLIPFHRRIHLDDDRAKCEKVPERRKVFL